MSSARLPDFNALNDDRTPHLFVCATNVKTNQRKIFGPGELGVGALTASACLPTIFRSIEIDGDFYWDGGYLGNPALSPLRSPALTPDLLIVWVNPLDQPRVPTNARDILDRLNEVSFNATLVQEIDDRCGQRAKPDRDRSARRERIRLHEIKDEPQLARLGTRANNTDWTFLLELRDFGVGRRSDGSRPASTTSAGRRPPTCIACCVASSPADSDTRRRAASVLKLRRVLRIMVKFLVPARPAGSRDAVASVRAPRTRRAILPRPAARTARWHRASAACKLSNTQPYNASEPR
jgi:hypothetical protein